MRSCRATSLFALAFLACASAASSAGARPPQLGEPSAEEREAQRAALYREAMKAAGAGRWAEAKERLHAVLALRASPKVLFSLAQTEEQLGQLASAQADYARALEGAALEGKGEVVQAAETAERALSARVPHLRAIVTGAEPGRPGLAASGASAMLDDQPLTLGAMVAVDPGDHRLAVSAPGMRSAIVNVKLLEGQQLDLPVSLEPERVARASVAPPPAPSPAPVPASVPTVVRPSAPPAPPAPPAPLGRAAPSVAAPNEGSQLRTAGVVAITLGVVAAGVGAAYGVESIGKHDDAIKECPGTACQSAKGAALWHDAVIFGNVSTIAFAVGGAALAGGAVLWLAAPKSSGAAAEVGLGLGSVQLRGAW